MSRQPVSRRRHGPEGIAAITLFVEDLAEAKRFYDEVKRRGAERLNKPVARPCGIRTATFRDPGGHVWEIAR